MAPNEKFKGRILGTNTRKRTTPEKLCKRCAYLCPIVPVSSTLVSLDWRPSCSDVQPRVARMWRNSPKVCKRLEYRYGGLRGNIDERPLAEVARLTTSHF